MSRIVQARVMFLSCVMLISIYACSKSKQSEDQAESGSTNNASGEKSADGSGDTKTGSDATGNVSTGNVPAAAFNIPELLGKMVWDAEIYNNGSGKIFSGFNGTNPYKILIDVSAYGELPETIQLSDEQYEMLYNSPEYKAAAKAEVAKISFEVDAAFLTSKMNEEYEEGRVYELTTVKAGSTTAKAKWGTKEIPLAITIASYTAAQVTAGKNRYNTAVAGATPSPACATCHRTATGADHSPYYMSQYTDAALLSTIETGLNTDDNYQTKTPHKMTFTNATDKAGIVAYLRSLDPNLLPDQQAAQ